MKRDIIGHYIVALVWGWNDNQFQDRFLLFARRCFGLCEVFLLMRSQRWAILSLTITTNELCWRIHRILVWFLHTRGNVFSFFLLILFVFDKGLLKDLEEKVDKSMKSISTLNSNILLLICLHYKQQKFIWVREHIPRLKIFFLFAK